MGRPKQVNGKRLNVKVNYIRYADDWLITGHTQEFLENEVKPMVAAFLQERGLKLSPEKTRVTHIAEGFDFLGQNIRTYKGKVLIKPANKKREQGGYSSEIDEKLTAEGSSWLVVRCFESLPKNRVRFAHTAPFHIEVSGKPLHPRPAEIDFLIRRVEEQIARSKDVLPAAALDEYREALRIYQAVKKAAEEKK